MKGHFKTSYIMLRIGSSAAETRGSAAQNTLHNRKP